ncbi:tetratricopeptide (TPR) repeat protein [Lewinella aquimaris]|uniref:Tetratricopeptide (TPR) repeat protein n=1 Tax=Neolewinella aquimaris TaxID=1835722 RepID=A0A840E4N6_9BACT|nr:tetratricopeptide repeat protein [Neolewinella aquimaris]MBB4078702.1 tetratricopeptide (TPR) repeat protein [Neolewinella aquimaris]
MLKKDLAGFFAFFLGVFGVHRFYLGQWWRGAAQFVGFWAIIAFLAEEGPEMPAPFILVGFVLAPIITAIVFWATPYERWAAKYDPEALVAQGYAPPTTTGRYPTVATAQAPKPSLKSLKAEGVKYYRSGDFDLAIEAFQEAIELAPSDPAAHFNVACCYALLGQYPAALRHLELAVTYRLPKPERIESHPALKELRASTAYRCFRSNNYRELNLVSLTQSAQPAPADEAEDVLEDFAAPPRSDASNRRMLDDDLLVQINRLRELHDAGVLTQQEYRKQREKLLG